MKECCITVYRKFNDRNSVNSIIDEVIEVDGASIIPGSPLPGWKFRPGIPIVEYYDGESLDLSLDGKSFNVIFGGDYVEVLSVHCPENIHVMESVSVCVSLGKIYTADIHPSWSGMYAHGSLSAIVMNALPAAESDPDAARSFLRSLTLCQNLFLLAPCAVELIEEYAEKGNRYALFALGRYHLCTQPEQDSQDKAIEHIRKAHELGLPEATVSLSMMYAYGDIGMVDRSKANDLLESAMRKGCEYAAEIYLKNMIFGLCGVPEDPKKALGFIERLLAEDIVRYEAGNENPLWHYYRGCSMQSLEGYSAGLEDFRKAAEMGVIQAWTDIAIACSYNDNDELVDRDAYIKAIEYGKTKRDSMCHYLLAMADIENYDELPKWKKMIERERIVINLEYAYSIGSSFAAESLGDIYYYGSYDIGEDNSLAWKWYAQGALLNNVSCYEKMFGMVHDHYIDEDTDFVDMLALHGARLGSEKLLNETVIAYTYGRLTGFAAEIEQYYEPVFDAGDMDDEDKPDDDGRFDAYA